MVGASIAFHLTRLGEKDVFIFEKNYVSSGSTGRCAGGIRQQWSTRNNVRLAMRSVEWFKRMKEDTGLDVEYKQGGYLILSFDEKEAEEFAKNVKMQKEEGLEVEVLTPKQVKRRFPYVNVEGVKLATFCPTDGHANPHLANFAYMRRSVENGARLFTKTEVKEIDVSNGTVRGVWTSAGYIECEVVINAAGPWSKNVGEMVGIDLPTESYRHQILVTEPLEHIMDPMIISFSGNFYIRQTHHGSFLMGQGDKDEKPGINRKVTARFLHEMVNKMSRRFPFLKNLRVIRQWCGEYNMSPDAQPIVGLSENVSGYFYAVGFSGHGFMVAPAVGEALAEWIVFGKPKNVDVSQLSLERFKGKEFLKERSVV
ncbi:MAG: FAD-dependent oxidoreductase [Thermotogae bacterium]|nr:MAG: FAD-dependent oxidoreductase [Thermotogota bacterium]